MKMTMPLRWIEEAETRRVCAIALREKATIPASRARSQLTFVPVARMRSLLQGLLPRRGLIGYIAIADVPARQLRVVVATGTAARAALALRLPARSR